jgi:superfamily II DNA/RNA helicase
LLVSSHTGSGKTAAFLLPGLQRMLQASEAKGNGPRMLVLTPTRELALQVEKAARDYGHNLRKLRTACLVGGSPYGLQLKALSQPVDIVIATPGRLMDHMERGRIDFSRLETLVLDEADRMLDMGFIDDIEAIVAKTPESRQTVLFSATLDGVVGKLAQRLTRNPKRIEVATISTAKANIEQRLFFADNHNHKTQLLDALLRDTELTQAVVFIATKRGAEDLSGNLRDQGFSAAALHGDMRQQERNRTLEHLRRGRTRILVATDVAARGIDVAGISHVINFEPPRQAEDYVHRIGRTGRAGRSGIAVTLAGHDERRMIREIERYTGQSLQVATIAGLEPKVRAERPHTPRPAGNGKSFGQKKWSSNGKPGSRAGSGHGGAGGYGNDRNGGARGSNERFGKPASNGSGQGGYNSERSSNSDRAGNSERFGNGDRPSRTVNSFSGGFNSERPAARKLTGFGGGYSDGRSGGSDRPSTRSGARASAFSRDGQPRRDGGSRSGPRAGGRRDY